MKADICSEAYLWNRNADGLIRVLQRIEALGVLPKQEIKAYEVRLEEIRAAFNAHFAQTMSLRERTDRCRLASQRIAWENKRREDESGN